MQRRERQRDQQRTAPAPRAARAPSARRRRCAAPTSGTVAWTQRHDSASTRAKWPSSTIIGSSTVAASLAGCHCAGPFFSAVGDFGRHVVLVVLGEHGRGDEGAVGVAAAFDHHALALAEQVGQRAGDRSRGRRGLPSVTRNSTVWPSASRCDAALLDQAADAHAPAAGTFMVAEIGRAVEEDEIVAERASAPAPRRPASVASPAEHDTEPPALARHRALAGARASSRSSSRSAAAIARQALSATSPPAPASATA